MLREPHAACASLFRFLKRIANGAWGGQLESVVVDYIAAGMSVGICAFDAAAFDGIRAAFVQCICAFVHLCIVHLCICAFVQLSI